MHLNSIDPKKISVISEFLFLDKGSKTKTQNLRKILILGILSSDACGSVFYHYFNCLSFKTKIKTGLNLTNSEGS